MNPYVASTLLGFSGLAIAPLFVWLYLYLAVRALARRLASPPLAPYSWTLYATLCFAVLHGILTMLSELTWWLAPIGSATPTLYVASGYLVLFIASLAIVRLFLRPHRLVHALALAIGAALAWLVGNNLVHPFFWERLHGYLKG